MTMQYPFLSYVISYNIAQIILTRMAVVCTYMWRYRMISLYRNISDGLKGESVKRGDGGGGKISEL